MKVKDLIKELEKYDADDFVRVVNGKGGIRDIKYLENRTILGRNIVIQLESLHDKKL